MSVQSNALKSVRSDSDRTRLKRELLLPNVKLRMIVQCILRVLFGDAAINTTCFLKRMYKLHVCRYITSVYPSLRYSLCFSDVFFLTIGLQYSTLLKQKQKKKKKKKIVEKNIKSQFHMYVCKT